MRPSSCLLTTASGSTFCADVYQSHVCCARRHINMYHRSLNHEIDGIYTRVVQAQQLSRSFSSGILLADGYSSECRSRPCRLGQHMNSDRSYFTEGSVDKFVLHLPWKTRILANKNCLIFPIRCNGK